MTDDINVLQFPENLNTPRENCEATAIRLVRKVIEHGEAGIPKHFEAAVALDATASLDLDDEAPPTEVSLDNATEAQAGAIALDTTAPLDLDDEPTPIEVPANITAEARAAIDDLEDEKSIDKRIRVGRAIAMAKEAMPHGSLTPWYRNELHKSESWCSLHFRLFQDRERLPAALEWAKTENHKFAGRYGMSELDKVLKDYKREKLGENAPSPRAARAVKPVAAKAPSDGVIARLGGIAAEVQRDLKGFRVEVEAAPSDELVALREALLAVIQRVDEHLRDRGQTCNFLQV